MLQPVPCVIRSKREDQHQHQLSIRWAVHKNTTASPLYAPQRSCLWNRQQNPRPWRRSGVSPRATTRTDLKGKPSQQTRNTAGDHQLQQLLRARRTGEHPRKRVPPAKHLPRPSPTRLPASAGSCFLFLLIQFHSPRATSLAKFHSTLQPNNTCGIFITSTNLDIPAERRKSSLPCVQPG